MKYVNNLLEVKPEEIEHVSNKTPIQAIIGVRNPLDPREQVIVIWENGESMSYSIDGRYNIQPEQRFIFKPVKHEGWINIYHIQGDREPILDGPYLSEEAAKTCSRFHQHHRSYVDTTKIEWKE